MEVKICADFNECLLQPSRELAEQTYNQIKLFLKHLKNPTLHHLLIIGGVNVKEQFASLNAGVSSFMLQKHF